MLTESWKRLPAGMWEVRRIRGTPPGLLRAVRSDQRAGGFHELCSVASLSPAHRTTPRGVPTAGGILHFSSVAFTKTIYALNFGRAAPGRLSADIRGCWESDYTECDLENPSSRRDAYSQEGRTSVGGYTRRTEASSHPRLARTY